MTDDELDAAVDRNLKLCQELQTPIRGKTRMKHVNTREHFLTYGAGALLGSAIATLNVVTNAPRWATPIVLFVAALYYGFRAYLLTPRQKEEG